MSRTSPELHLHEAELLEVCAELECSKNRVLLGQHDERRARQAAVDVKAEPVQKKTEMRWLKKQED